ncbi:hypothetical protein SaccyDRAFT_4677 [Saccharomonospora cyanea NA-134]|uniref:Uncharacterized protein n=1 Tax=Saccharomonospora cyanea NA-134 TaxID=882082 RepID=H5XD53_9PSEU|nr:hypothetical protein SaccyDRAFT_4677 [Saccharomonospora cyanea NA-134]
MSRVEHECRVGHARTFVATLEPHPPQAAVECVGGRGPERSRPVGTQWPVGADEGVRVGDEPCSVHGGQGSFVGHHDGLGPARRRVEWKAVEGVAEEGDAHRVGSAVGGDPQGQLGGPQQRHAPFVVQQERADVGGHAEIPPQDVAGHGASGRGAVRPDQPGSEPPVPEREPAAVGEQVVAPPPVVVDGHVGAEFELLLERGGAGERARERVGGHTATRCSTVSIVTY